MTARYPFSYSGKDLPRGFQRSGPWAEFRDRWQAEQLAAWLRGVKYSTCGNCGRSPPEIAGLCANCASRVE